jgi:hypothetical protein
VNQKLDSTISLFQKNPKTSSSKSAYAEKNKKILPGSKVRTGGFLDSSGTDQESDSAISGRLARFRD